jgi:P-type Cu2+ transporter
MHDMAESHETQNANEEPKMNHLAEPSKTHEVHRGRHEGHKTSDFKKRFLMSLILTIPILVLSPFIQSLVGYQLEFPGSIYVLFLLSTLVYFYGGYPFLKGFFLEIKDNNIGMMTLIAVAIARPTFTVLR